MRTYNYLSNELPRELIEIYSDIEQDLLRVMVKELKKGTPPNEVFAKAQQKIKQYDSRTQKVLAVIFADIKKKAVAEGVKDFQREEEDEHKEAVDNRHANALIAPMVIAGMGILGGLNKRLTGSVVNEYTTGYLASDGGQDKRMATRFFNKLANSGLTIYEQLRGKAPRAYSLENIIRRDVMFQVNQANAKVNMENFEQSSAQFIETTSHPTARTWNKYMKHAYEDHSSWQGEVFYSRDGQQVEGYREFESTCGYGELLGICGINCYHQFKMNYTGTSAYTQYDRKEVERQYALSQEQRGFERSIRKMKTARAVWQEAGDTEKAKKFNIGVRNATRQLQNFCEKNKIKYFNWRTQI